MIILLGSNSRLGNYFSQYLKLKDIHHLNVPRGILNFANYEHLLKVLPTKRISYIVNFCALTNVDECEKNYAKALESNATIVERLCEYKKNNSDFHLIHISTDQIYSDSGFQSEISGNPINYYSKTKLLGELHAAKIGATIIRTNFFGKTTSHTPRRSFTDWLFDAGINKTPINVYSNVLFNPVRMETLSNVILTTINLKYSGIINIGAKNGLSKEQFARIFFEQLNFDKNLLLPSFYSPNIVSAKRPLDMRMNVSKAVRDIGYAPQNLEDEIFPEVLRYLNKI